MKPNVFVLRGDYGRYTDTFRNEGYCGIGWFDEDPLDWDLTNRDLLKQKYKEKNPD